MTRLGSRALVPGEITSTWELADYVALTSRAGLEADLQRIVRRATARRRMDPDRLRDVLGALARPPMIELNRARIGSAAGVAPTTLPPYVDVLVDAGVVRLLPGCRSPVAIRAIGRPRVVLDDVALARHLAGDAVEDLLEFGGRRRLAPLLATAVAGELLRQQRGSAVSYRLSHLRERNGLQVDLVVELEDNTVYGLEVRTASSIRPHQFTALEALAARAGSSFRRGVVLNTARVGHQYRPGLWAMPVSSLWDRDKGDGGDGRRPHPVLTSP